MLSQPRVHPERLRRLVYMVIAAWSMLAALAGVVVYSLLPEMLFHPWALGISAASAALNAVIIVLLLTRTLGLGVAGYLLILAAVTTTFSLLGLALYSPEINRTSELTALSTYLWLPILYMLAFLVVSPWRALIYALGIFGLTVLITLPYALSSIGKGGILDGFSVPGTLYLSNFVIILTLYFFSTFRNRMVEAEREALIMEHLAFTDELTGIANRRQMEQLIRNEIARDQRYGRPFSVVLVDIDHFKRINDNYGHDVGDQVLKDVADCIATHIRASDHLARWGGEEFLVLAPETKLAEATTLAEHLRQSVETRTFVGGHSLTISLGVAGFHIQDTVTSLIKRADEALYVAKRQGKNQVVNEDALAASSHS